MAEEFDDLDLNSLNDEELTEQVHDDLYNGLREEVVEATNIMLGRGWSASRVLDDALVEGMRIVGVDFRDGISAPSAGRNRCRADWQDGHWHRQRRHP